MLRNGHLRREAPSERWHVQVDVRPPAQVAGPPRRMAYVRRARLQAARPAKFEQEVPTVAQGTRWVGLDAARVTALMALETEDGLGKGEAAGRLPIVMGLDQHRAQITAEWIDLETGEISRGRVAPADRAAVGRFLGRFAGRQLEVVLEATTGWRFVVEELDRVGAGVHWPSGRRRAGCGDRRSARRPTGLMRGICGSCC